MGDNEKGNSRGKARAARVKEMKKEIAVIQDVNRAKDILRAKYQALLSHQSEIHQLRGAMLGVIEAFDLTAQDANNLLGVEYFAEFDEGMTPAEMAEQVKSAQGGGEILEPEPVEPDTDVRG